MEETVRPGGHGICVECAVRRSPAVSDAGGKGFILGDGSLNYGREQIFESYYTVHIGKGLYALRGVQYVVNPGYNQDRRPVVIPTFRVHVEL